MVGISAVSINGAPSSSIATGQEGSLSVDLSKVRDTGKTEEAAGAGGAASAEEEPAHIKQLRQMIQRLQKQLAEQMKQLQQAMASKMEETAKASAVAGAQAAVSATSAALQSATAQLLKALTDSGTSSSGSMVSTTA
mgnify:CR=1 FL=1